MSFKSEFETFEIPKFTKNLDKFLGVWAELEIKFVFSDNFGQNIVNKFTK